MPSHRRQHYVPRAYLSLFSPDGRKTIGTFSLATRRLIPQAPIKYQAARSYFYGTDGEMEGHLGSIEDEAAPLLRLARDDHVVPARDSRALQALFNFVATLNGRTVGAQAMADQASEAALRAYARRKAEFEGRSDLVEALPKVRFVRKHGVLESLAGTMIGAPLLYDLATVIIVNESPSVFLTSDTPAVLHNRRFEDHLANDTAGFGSVGLQIMLPLGPRTMLLCYDAASYSVLGETDGKVHVSDLDAVQTLNGLQWEAAHELMFVPDTMSHTALVEDLERWSHVRSPDRIVFREKEVGISESQIRVSQGVGPKPSRIALNLPFLEMRHLDATLDGNGVAPLRNPDLMQALQALMRRIGAG